MDRIWFVTGTSSGFGREIAQTALAAGDRVVATARRTDGLTDLVEQAPDRVRAVALDVTDPAAVRPPGPGPPREPEPFRTDFAGRSAVHGAPIEDYAPILGPSRERFLAQDGRQPGDPGRAAQVIVDLVGLDDPPLRLPLGAAAFDRIRTTLSTRLADLDAVEPIGRGTDFAAEPAG